jgi:hypothetical protein
MNQGITLLLVSALLTACLGKPEMEDAGGSPESNSSALAQPVVSVSPGSSSSGRYRNVDLVLVVDDTDEADVYRTRMKGALASLGNSLLKNPDTNTCLAIVLASRAWSRSGKEIVIGCSKPSNAENLSAEQLNTQADAMIAAAVNFIPATGATIKAPLGKALVAFLYNSLDWDYFKYAPSSTLRSFFRADALTHFHFFSHMNNWRQINPATLIAGQENTGAWHIQERRMDLPMVRNMAYTILGNASNTEILGWSPSWPATDTRKGYKEYIDESLGQLKGGLARYSVSTMMTQYDENDYGLLGCYQGISNRAQNMKNLVSVVQNGPLEGNIQLLSGTAYESFYQNLGQSLISRSMAP